LDGHARHLADTAEKQQVTVHRWFRAGLAFAALCTQQLHAQTTADTIRRLDSAWARSYARNDTMLARSLFAPDLIVTSGSGALKDFEGEMADVRPYPGASTKYFRTADVQIRVRGGSAITAGLIEWEFEMNGRASANRRRYTATWARGGPLGWQILAIHIGQAPPPR
jgi:ketosteroid isomerase-like protein